MYLAKDNPHGGDIYGEPPKIDFSASLNPLGMPPEVRRALSECAETCAAYPDPYCRALREAIGHFEGVPAGNILCGAGASELIYHYAAALTGEGPGLILAPAFSEYALALELAGRGAEYRVLTPEEGFHLAGGLGDLGRYSAVFLCSPNNPTGLALEPEVIWETAGSGANILLDLSFLDLTLSPGRYRVPELTARYPNVTVLRSPGKSFAVPGVRLGYAISSDRALLERMSERGQCWNVSVPAAAAGEAAMGCGEWLRRSAVIIAEERERLTRELKNLGLTVYPGEANFLLMYSAADIVTPLKRSGLALRDCRNFVGLGPGYVRAAVRRREENDALLRALREVIA